MLYRLRGEIVEAEEYKGWLYYERWPSCVADGPNGTYQVNGERIRDGDWVVTRLDGSVGICQRSDLSPFEGGEKEVVEIMGSQRAAPVLIQDAIDRMLVKAGLEDWQLSSVFSTRKASDTLDLGLMIYMGGYACDVENYKAKIAEYARRNNNRIAKQEEKEGQPC